MRKYIKLSQYLKNEISQGKYLPGDKLPTENELSTQHNISRQTVRRALGVLVEEGIISKIQGSGSFVCEHQSSRKLIGRIGVIVTYISQYIFPSILRGIDEIATNNSSSIMLNATNNSIATERNILKQFLENPVDGMIIEGTKTALPNPNLSFYNELTINNVPMVFINGYYPELQHPNIVHVVTDDYGGGFQSVARLIEQGHRNIGGIFKSDDIQGIQRFSGYIDAMADLGGNITDDNILWFTTELKPTLTTDMKRRFSSILQNCTALVCYNDEIASSVFPLIKDNPNSIISISSFDQNNDICETDISFFSFGHPKEKLGRISAQKLFQMINGEKIESTILPWSIEL